MHPEHIGETIAIGRTGQHWRSQKKKLVPDVKGVQWEAGMQLVTIEHVYPQWRHLRVMFPDQQRPGILTLGDTQEGAFDEDATVIWKTNYLKYVEVGNVKWHPPSTGFRQELQLTHRTALCYSYSTYVHANECCCAGTGTRSGVYPAEAAINVWVLYISRKLEPWSCRKYVSEMPYASVGINWASSLNSCNCRALIHNQYSFVIIFCSLTFQTRNVSCHFSLIKDYCYGTKYTLILRCRVQAFDIKKSALSMVLKRLVLVVVELQRSLSSGISALRFRVGMAVWYTLTKNVVIILSNRQCSFVQKTGDEKKRIEPLRPAHRHHLADMSAGEAHCVHHNPNPSSTSE